MKILITIFFLIVSLYGKYDISNLSKENFSVDDVKKTENTLLKEAIATKDYEAISAIGIIFFHLSKSLDFKGDKKKLLARSIELLEIAHNHNHIPASLFLVVSFLQSDYKYAQKIAKDVILKSFSNDVIASNNITNSITLLYASSILDHNRKSTDDINFAIEALERLNLTHKVPEVDFYLAWLFKLLGSYEIADSYLNEACHYAKIDSKIYGFCFGDNVARKDPTEDRVIKKNCKADAGKRCK